MIDLNPDLLSFIKTEYDRCRDDTLEEERETAIERYNGEPYGDEEDGYSQVVSRDTAETIDYMVISILRTIVSGERVVEFVHRNVEAAHEATETIMHLLMDEQDGYRILHDWLKSGLLEKTATAMTYPEPQEAKRQVTEGVSALALMAAEQQGLKVIEAEVTGGDEENPIFTVTTMEDQPPKFCDHAVPNEEFYCSPDARNLDEAAIKGRRVRKTLSDLVAMGFDRDEVEQISDGHYSRDTVSQARDEERYNDVGQREGMSRVVWWHEEYVRFDANGDGIAELLYIQRSADHKIFAVEEMEDEEDHPFVEWCPYPMPHRRVGQSLADKVMDIERIRTVLMRQSLNGIYLSNNPSTYVHEDSIGENTIDDLLTVRPGRLIRYKGPVEPKERNGAFDPGAGFQMLEFMNRERETRTGITRLNMGLDEDTLNTTAKGQAQLIARGEQQEEYIARNFGNAVAKLITKKAKLLQRYGKPIEVPIDGKYKMVDPSQWPADMIARARVGMGASRKEQRIAFRREVLDFQGQAMEAGLGIVDEQRLYNSMKGYITDVGLGDVAEYFIEPPKDEQGNPVPKPEKPDPEMAKVQAEAQRKAQEQQAKIDEKLFDMRLREAEAEAKNEVEMVKARSQAMIAQQRAQFEASLADAKADFEARLALRKTAFEEALASRKSMVEEVNMSDNREGGDLDK